MQQERRTIERSCYFKNPITLNKSIYNRVIQQKNYCTTSFNKNTLQPEFTIRQRDLMQPVIYDVIKKKRYRGILDLNSPNNKNICIDSDSEQGINKNNGNKKEKTATNLLIAKTVCQYPETYDSNSFLRRKVGYNTGYYVKKINLNNKVNFNPGLKKAIVRDEIKPAYNQKSYCIPCYKGKTIQCKNYIYPQQRKIYYNTGYSKENSYAYDEESLSQFNTRKYENNTVINSSDINIQERYINKQKLHNAYNNGSEIIFNRNNSNLSKTIEQINKDFDNPNLTREAESYHQGGKVDLFFSLSREGIMTPKESITRKFNSNEQNMVLLINLQRFIKAYLNYRIACAMKIQAVWRGINTRKIMDLYNDLDEFIYHLSKVQFNHFGNHFCFFINQLFNIYKASTSYDNLTGDINDQNDNENCINQISADDFDQRYSNIGYLFKFPKGTKFNLKKIKPSNRISLFLEKVYDPYEYQNQEKEQKYKVKKYDRVNKEYDEFEQKQINNNTISRKSNDVSSGLGSSILSIKSDFKFHKNTDIIDKDMRPSATNQEDSSMSNEYDPDLVINKDDEVFFNQDDSNSLLKNKRFSYVSINSEENSKYFDNENPKEKEDNYKTNISKNSKISQYNTSKCTNSTCYRTKCIRIQNQDKFTSQDYLYSPTVDKFNLNKYAQSSPRMHSDMMNNLIVIPKRQDAFNIMGSGLASPYANLKSPLQEYSNNKLNSRSIEKIIYKNEWNNILENIKNEEIEIPKNTKMIVDDATQITNDLLLDNKLVKNERFTYKKINLRKTENLKSDEVIKFNILKNVYKKPNKINRYQLNIKGIEKKKENEEIQVNLCINTANNENIYLIDNNEIFIKGAKNKDESLRRLLEEKDKQIEKLQNKINELTNKKFDALKINNDFNEIEYSSIKNKKWNELSNENFGIELKAIEKKMQNLIDNNNALTIKKVKKLRSETGKEITPDFNNLKKIFDLDFSINKLYKIKSENRINKINDINLHGKLKNNILKINKIIEFNIEKNIKEKKNNNKIVNEYQLNIEKIKSIFKKENLEVENQKNNTFGVLKVKTEFSDAITKMNKYFQNLSFDRNNQFILEKTRNIVDKDLYIVKLKEMNIGAKNKIKKDFVINRKCQINFDKINQKDIKITTKKVLKYDNIINNKFTNTTLSKENQITVNGIKKISSFEEKLNVVKIDQINIINPSKKEIKIVTKKIVKKTNVLSPKFKNIEITTNNKLTLKNIPKKELPLEIIFNEKINLNGYMKPHKENLIINKKNAINIFGKRKETKFDKQKLVNENQNNIFISKNVKKSNDLGTEITDDLKNIQSISNEQFSLENTASKEVKLVYKKTKTNIVVSPIKKNYLPSEIVNIQITGIKNQIMPLNIFNQDKLINDKNSELTIEKTLHQKINNIIETGTSSLSILNNLEKINEVNKEAYEKVIEKNIQFCFDKLPQKQIEKTDEMTQIESNEKKVEKIERTTDTLDLILPKQIKITTRKTIKTVNNILHKFKNNEISSENNINLSSDINTQKIKKDNNYIVKKNNLIIKKSYLSPKESKKEADEKYPLINWSDKLNIDNIEKFDIIHLPKREIKIKTKKVLKTEHYINHKFKNTSITKTDDIDIKKTPLSKVRNIEQNCSFTINQKIKKTKENETEIGDDLINIQLINNDEFSFNKLEIKKKEKMKNSIEDNNKFTILKTIKEKEEKEEKETKNYNIETIKNMQFTVGKLEKTPIKTADEEIQYDESLIPEKKVIKLVTKKTLKKINVLNHRFKDNIIAQGNQFIINGKQFENINENTKDNVIQTCIFDNNIKNDENIRQINKNENIVSEPSVYENLKVQHKNILIKTKIRKVINVKSKLKLEKFYKKIKENLTKKNTFNFWKKLVENSKKEEETQKINELKIKRLKTAILKYSYKSCKNYFIKWKNNVKTPKKKKRKINISKLSIKKQIIKMPTSPNIPIKKPRDTTKDDIMKLRNFVISKNKPLLTIKYFKLWKSFTEKTKQNETTSKGFKILDVTVKNNIVKYLNMKNKLAKIRLILIKFAISHSNKK